MKFKRKLASVLAVLLISALAPVNALAAVKLRVSEADRIYDKTEIFDTYIELESTGYGLVKNTATIILQLNNGEFAKTEDGDYLPVYVYSSRSQLDRDEIEKELVDGTIVGFGVIPSDENSVRIKLPESMIDKYAHILVSATGEEYGVVTISIRNNRDIKFILDDSLEAEKDEKPAEEVKPKVIIPIGSNIIFVGDKRISVDAPAFISNDVTKIPLRAVAEIFGADVYWNNAEKSATIEIGDDVIYLQAGSHTMFVNGFGVPLLAGPEVADGRMFVPLRDIAQMFGIEEIEWNAEAKCVVFDLQEYDGHNCLTYEQHK